MQSKPRTRLSRVALRLCIGLIAGAPLIVAPIAVGAQQSSTAQSKRLLSPTPAQVEGPYFLNNSPIRSNLIPSFMSGQAIQITGQVTDTAGNVLPNATVHVWLASPQGHYDNEDAQGNPVAIPLNQQILRGRIITDHQGKYTFDCLRPGNYSLGNGMMRPAHIHVRVEAPGHKTLITQLYFTDDQFNLKDLPGPGFFKPELLVPLLPGTPQSGVTQHGNFNFVLSK